MPDPHATTPSAASGTAVVVLATTEASGLRCAEGTLPDRLTGQLVTLPVRDVHVVTRAVDIIHAPGGTHMIGAEGSRGLADDLRRVARAARASTGPVAVVAGDLVAHTEALAVLFAHPARDTAALVSTGDDPGPPGPPVRVEGGKVVAAATSFHEAEEANGTFRGAFQVGADDRVGFAETAEALADLVEAGRFGPMDGGEAADLLLVGLIRSGAQVRAARLGPLHAVRVTGQAEADAAVSRLAQVDEAAARLDAAVKTNDGFFATYGVSSWSRYLVKPAARLRLTPNAVTGISVGLAALAAVWFSAGTRPALIAGAVLLYLSFVLDCVDGQLARYTRAFSPLGAWLDATFDRVKEYAVYVGLAFGYTAGLESTGGGPDGIWALAVAAMILQVLRHMIDFSYAGARADAGRVGAAWARTAGSLTARVDEARRLVPLHAPEPSDAGRSGRPGPGGRPAPGGPASGTGPAAETGTGAGPGPAPESGAGPAPETAVTAGAGLAPEAGVAVGVAAQGGIGSEGAGAVATPRAPRRTAGDPEGGNAVVRLSRSLEGISVTRWLKKIIVLPIGERMALIAVTAAVFNARVTFIALLVWGGVAALYTLTGRVGRSLSR
ncbi:hypothetical protein GCM10010517_53140 [Streptosporangium fragile]|uniref:Bifunctional IPC transferase and DIPP synthase n=1 Tax=Streptosporangium fragile TaxID=46186 RepID=A0ABN3W5T0_9ACTN